MTRESLRSLSATAELLVLNALILSSFNRGMEERRSCDCWLSAGETVVVCCLLPM